MPNIYVKCIDAQVHRLDVNKQYPLQYLASLPPTVVNVALCKTNQVTINAMKAKLATGGKLTAAESAKYNSALIYNSGVSAHFNTCQYLDFLHTQVKVNNVINTNILLSIHNAPKLDNAFFTGEYMVYGNGDTMMTPLSTMDVGGHELGHGLVQTFAGLEYEGHSGALNESFADIMGVCFEFFMYKKFNEDADKTNDIDGKADWTMGEDCGKSIKFLRNMADPTKAQYPQPKVYRGQYWANPNSKEDFGGVHQNSGVANYCFYKFCERTNLKVGLDTFLACLRKLKPRASFVEYRDTLKEVSGGSPAMLAALSDAGLTDTIVSDWAQRRV
jgi:Zn-dependent metalloprotease